MPLNDSYIAKFLRPLEPLVQSAPPLDLKALAAPLGGAAPTAGSLATYSTQLQEQTNWCWAAVGASTAAFFSAAAWTAQCTIAQSMLGLVCCPADPNNVGAKTGPGGCNNPESLDGSLSTIGHFDHRVDSTVLFSDLSNEIVGVRPVGVRIKWNGAGNAAHFIAVIGYSVIGGEEWVDVGDPAHGFVQVKYKDLVSAYGSGGTVGSWTNTYYVTSATQPPVGGSVLPVAVGPHAP